MSAYRDMKPGPTEAERVTECRKKVLRQVNVISAHLSDSELFTLLKELEICMQVSAAKLAKNKKL